MAQVIWNSDIDVYDSQVIPVSVAKNICKYLLVQDLLSFSQVSKNAYKTVNDPNIWVSRLKIMEVWDSGIIPESNMQLKEMNFEFLSNPLTCLDSVVKTTKVAKFQVLKIHTCLFPYYNDLLSNKPYDKLKIFKDFQTPEEQSKILNNLLKFNRIDFFEDSRIPIRDKINTLFEIFENALLRELEIHFDIQDYAKTRQFVQILIDLKNQQTLIDFFLQKTVFDNEVTDFFSLETFEAEKYFVEIQLEGTTSKSLPFKLNFDNFHYFIQDLAAIFNQEAEIIDLIFSQSIPMMYKVCEELISNQLMELIMTLIDTSKEKRVYLTIVPYLYEQLTTNFIEQLKPSENVGESYFQLVRELIDMSFESFAAEYMREEVSVFNNFSNENILEWTESISKREAETTQNILKYVKIETKNDFLTSFKKVFTINASSSKTEDDTNDKNYSEIQAKAKILSENIKSLNKIFSPELVLDILNEAKTSLNRLFKFREFSIASLKSDIFSSMQDIFIEAIESIGNEHLRPGFSKAIEYLQTYNPKNLSYTSSHNESFVEPLVLFFELINMADLIIQMIDIFYKEEMLNKQIVKHENSILNPSIQNKKKLEAIVDKYVADGLNIGIEILVSEIESIYTTYLTDSDYCPPPGATTALGPTDAAKRAVKVLDENIDLLVDSADKSIVEVFQQEIAERFFQIIVKALKKSTISVVGATNLISDLNLYYDFIVTRIKTNKKLIVPLFQALKKIGNIYLISGDDSKSIGKLVSDLSKFNGIFGQEEIYEFVQRRQDWLLIRKDVEKVMYGFGLGDCTIV